MPISKHEEKMLNLRTQIQQNQSELQDYLADLDNWEKDIKQKENQLKTGQAAKGQDLPPVRNTLEKKKMKKRKTEKKAAGPGKPKRISGFDFRAWDKFDVDKALEEVDNKADETSSSEYETDEEWEIERKKHLAGVQKDKGNEFLKSGDYDKAVEAYSKGIEFDPANAILPANRAMALLKQQKFAAAELDCTTCISLDPLYVKAYLRRATARAGMGKCHEAVADYKKVLDLEPSNKQAQSEMERLQKEITREKEVPVLSTLAEKGKGVVKPIYKQPEERSKAPLKRIFIEEIGTEPSRRQHPVNLEQSDVAKKITVKEGENFDRLFTSSVSQTASAVQQPSAPASADSSTPSVSSSLTSPSGNSQSRNSINQEQADISSEPVIENQDFSRSTIPSNVLKTEKRPPWNAASNIESNISRSSNRQARADSESANNQRSPASRTTDEGDKGDSFSIPQTSFQFQADFRLLKDKPETFFQYFQAIPPAQYPKLFGQCLDADILTAVLKTLATNSDRLGNDLYEVLHQLTQVKRFSMTVMFLSKLDKQHTVSLMECLSKSGTRPQNDILSLSRKYDLRV